MKVVFATPSVNGPTAPYISALEQSIPLITGAGWDEAYVQEVGNPYISAARANLLRRALDGGADVVVFLDYDLSWRPRDLLTLITTPGDVVAGTYRFKHPDIDYMGTLDTDAEGRPLLRQDGCMLANRVPAGFLKITKEAVCRFMKAYPELVYGPAYNPSVDLFNHGAHDGIWWGEDYAFSRRWRGCGGELTLVPDLAITHHATAKDGTDTPYPGNFHTYMLARGVAQRFAAASAA